MLCNVEAGIPRSTGLILLFDPATKTPMGVMDAQAISATRTGGVTLLAAKKIADPSTEEISIVGAGVNMRTQLLGLKEALPSLRRVKVYSRNNTKNVFAEEMSKRTGLLIIPVEKPELAAAQGIIPEEKVEDLAPIITGSKPGQNIPR